MLKSIQIKIGRPFFRWNVAIRTLSQQPKLERIVQVSNDNQRTSESDSNNGRYSFFKGLITGGVFAFGIWAYDQFNQNNTTLEAARIIKDDELNNSSSKRFRYNFVADVVEQTNGSLVSIKIKDKNMTDYYSGEPVVLSNGSGFIVQEDGLILTNAHVVSRARSIIEVQLQDGRCLQGSVEDLDRKSDLATVRINCKNLPVMKLGTSKDIRVGEFVVAMGSPLSLSNTITFGVVSSVARDKKDIGIKQELKVPEYIQTDATITFGNSGGPLINLDGEAIGVNSMKMSPGISFAIPIDYAKDFLQKCEDRRKGKLPRQKSRRYLGIKMISITPRILPQLRAKVNMNLQVSQGVFVYEVMENSPADNAGIHPGDIITHANGKLLRDCTELYDLLENDDALALTILRGHQYFTLSVDPIY